MAFCPKCGSQINDNSTFCAYCGASTTAQNFNQSTNNYQQPLINEAPVTTDRSLVMFILLTIVTCGFYSYYFVYKLAKDVNQICKEDGDHVGGLAAFILLSYVTCGIYAYYWYYKIQNRLYAAAPRYGVMVTENGTTVLLWMIIGALLCGIGFYVGMHIIIKTANAVGAAYNAQRFGRP